MDSRRGKRASQTKAKTTTTKGKGKKQTPVQQQQQPSSSVIEQKHQTTNTTKTTSTATTTTTTTTSQQQQQQPGKKLLNNIQEDKQPAVAVKNWGNMMSELQHEIAKKKRRVSFSPSTNQPQQQQQQPPQQQQQPRTAPVVVSSGIRKPLPPLPTIVTQPSATSPLPSPLSSPLSSSTSSSPHTSSHSLDDHVKLYKLSPSPSLEQLSILESLVPEKMNRPRSRSAMDILRRPSDASPVDALSCQVQISPPLSPHQQQSLSTPNHHHHQQQQETSTGGSHVASNTNTVTGSYRNNSSPRFAISEPIVVTSPSTTKYVERGGITPDPTPPPTPPPKRRLTPVHSDTTATNGHNENKIALEQLKQEREKLQREKMEFEKMKQAFEAHMKHEKEAIEREKRKLKELMQRAEASLQRSESTKRVETEPVPFKLNLVVEHNSPERPISVRFVAKNSNELPSPETPTTSTTPTTAVESDEEEQDDQKTESDITSPGESVTGEVFAEDMDSEAEAYNSYVLKRLQRRRTSLTNLNEYQDILSEDEQTSVKRASLSSKLQIYKEISLLIGDRSLWSSESEEVLMFRNNMGMIKSATVNDRFSQDVQQSVLPPVYLTSDPAVSSFDTTKDLMCKIYIPQTNVYKTLTCKPNTTADELLEKLVSKMSTDNTLKLVRDEILFKASGSSDYIYGDVPLIQFEHVWNCVKTGARVTLTVVAWNSLWNDLDPHDVALKSSNYDYDYNNAEKLTGEACLFSWNCAEPFRFKLCGVDSLEYDSASSELYIISQLFMGNIPITQEKFSQVSEHDIAVRLGQYVNFTELLVSEIPREATIRIICYTRAKGSTGQVASIGSKDVLMAAVTVPVYDYNGILKSGIREYKMWLELKPFLCTENNDPSSNAPLVLVEFDARDKPVLFGAEHMKLPDSLSERWIKYEQKRMNSFPKLSHGQLLAEFNRIVNTDPIYVLNEEERYRLWSVRSSAQLLTSNPRALFKFMQSVPWQHPQAVVIAHQLLDKWEKLDPIDAIGLLNFSYVDSKLRRYAVKILSQISDNELKELLLQLVQTLKFELYHDSALARFLIERGLQSTQVIGHVLFWHMKAEMHDPCIRERYGLVLEEYLTNCGSHRRELLKQNGIVDQLFNIAMTIKETKKADQLTVLRKELAKITIPPKFKLPLSTRVDLKGILIDKCKVMNSKKLPLWLVFENADKTGEPFYVIFKAGDDLRQDLLTLQMLKNMDVLWKSNALHLRMNPYGCICLGDMVGMIEVVTNSDTVANITNERGGASAAFSVDPLTIWLKKQCRTDEAWLSCVENFIKSCAAYCVATYVLGIGDRHNDNIMLTKKGDLFHIDFGHFLGHFKSFKGIYKRETTPFVFTPMYAHVMGGTDAEDYKEFVNLSCQAYLTLRKYGHMLMNMFLLMLAAGIPELTTLEHIAWLRKVLVLEYSDEEARKHFTKMIKKSLKNTRARINDAVHIYAKK